ncbi:hypothetical protein QWJ34_13360 [Saccharibacillus sp. CPCC 101409]|uniref:hypothetical protein n=1 Tax=Saccharibacillus sp. CPCC 101409 TaxID=3058041 RepID=UPI0026739420|nr:hypothetical protein [Saccharibacillus sp. CPCC 101409]MDO3410754.1 hypothetical protein [Saccharibacillus sp. CPCC 101409]
MNETLMQILGNTGAMIGLFGGIILGLLGWGFGRYMQRKNRGRDERAIEIETRAKSFVWNVMLPAIWVGWALIFLFDGVDLPFFVMMALFVISQIAYVSSTVYQNGRI